MDLTLYIAIGFLSASLAAVVFLPTALRRAARFSAARARGRSGPTRALAEEVTRRGRSAIEIVRLERQLALSRDEAAALRSEVGKASFHLVEARSRAEKSASALDEKTKEVERLGAEMRELEAQLSSSQQTMHDLTAQRDRVVAAHRVCAGREKELEAQASRDRAKIAILVTRSEHLEARVSDLLRATQPEKPAVEKTPASQRPPVETGRAGGMGFQDRSQPAFDRGDSKTRRIPGVGSGSSQFQRRMPRREDRLRAGQGSDEDGLVETAGGLAEANLAKERESEPRSGAESENAGRLTPPENQRSGQDFMTFGSRIKSLAADATEDSGDADEDLRTSLKAFGDDVMRRYAARLG